jgi:DNA repair exonuclease SbcCD ATPase subunit
MEFEDLLSKVDDLTKSLEFAKKEYKRAKSEKIKIKQKILDFEKSRIAINKYAKKSQKETKKQIEYLVTLAIRSIFDREFTFKLDFQEKANKVYAIPIVIDGKDEFTNLKEDLGGSMVDIISLAFKIVLWSMEVPRKRPLFIIDEPFRFTGRLVKKAGYMLKYLSKELGFQVIMVSHDDELIDICDRVWGVIHNGKHSVVKLLKGGKIVWGKSIKRIIKRR